jgi:hypothetical protein
MTEPIVVQFGKKVKPSEQEITSFLVHKFEDGLTSFEDMIKTLPHTNPQVARKTAQEVVEATTALTEIFSLFLTWSDEESVDNFRSRLI